MQNVDAHLSARIATHTILPAILAKLWASFLETSPSTDCMVLSTRSQGRAGAWNAQRLRKVELMVAKI